MLSTQHQRGIKDALQRYNVKEAGWLDAVKRVGAAGGQFLFGQPNKLLPKGVLGGEGLAAFKPGGSFSLDKILWPTIRNSQGQISPMATWLNRGFGTILPAYGALQALRGKSGDPNEGRLTNTLSGVGRALGSAYGFSLGGIFGAPILTQAGETFGRQLGHMLGSRPTPRKIELTPDDLQRLMATYQTSPGGF